MPLVSGTIFFDVVLAAPSSRWVRHYGLRGQTYRQFGPGLYDTVNVGIWGGSRWGAMSWGLWEPTAGFPYPSWPEQPSRYRFHYGYGVAGSPIDQGSLLEPNLPSVGTAIFGAREYPDILPSWRPNTYVGTPTGAFGPVPFESILEAVLLPQASVEAAPTRHPWRWGLTETPIPQVITDFRTIVWTEPASAVITSSWTEPADAAITSSWTEPAESAITSSWTEPAVTPITPSPEV